MIKPNPPIIMAKAPVTRNVRRPSLFSANIPAIAKKIPMTNTNKDVNIFPSNILFYGVNNSLLFQTAQNSKKNKQYTKHYTQH